MKILHCAATVKVGKLTAFNYSEQDMAAEFVHTNLKIDPSNWSSYPDYAVNDLASSLVEQGNRPMEERINYHELYFDKKGLIRDKKTHQALLQGLRKQTRLDKLEIKGAQAMCHWAQNQTKEAFCLWISPPSDESEDHESYVESRFVIWHLNTIGDGVEIAARGICGNHSQEECLDIANQIQTEIIFSHPDELRVSPLPFMPPKDIAWTKYLKEIIGMEQVWENIEKGEDKLMRQKADKISEQVVKEFFPKISKARSNFEQKQIQYQMELRAAELGMPTQCYGGCEITFRENIKSPFQVFFNGTKEKTMPCPNPDCGAMIVVGSEKCEACGLTKKDYDRKRLS